MAYIVVHTFARAHVPILQEKLQAAAEKASESRTAGGPDGCCHVLEWGIKLENQAGNGLFNVVYYSLLSHMKIQFYTWV